jgi:N-acetylglucosamine malate deacetylase 2
MQDAQAADSDLPMALRALVDGRTSIGPIALVVAHPDDEVIGVGGQLRRWSPNLVCVYATDGAPADGQDAQLAGFDNAASYGRARAAESRRALEHAGVSADRIRTLGFIDQQLVSDLAKLDAAIEAVLSDIRPSVVITHAFEGGHPDHDALALVLASIARRRRARDGDALTLVEFAGYWQDEAGALVTNRFAPPHTDSERQLRMSLPHRQQKQVLMACFETQEAALRTFDVRAEWIRLAPAYDFRAAPNGGRVWYDRFPWPVRSEEWLRLAARYLDRAPAPAPRLVC